MHKDMASDVLGCQTDLNALESSSFQYHHHTGLCTIIGSIDGVRVYVRVYV